DGLELEASSTERPEDSPVEGDLEHVRQVARVGPPVDDVAAETLDEGGVIDRGRAQLHDSIDAEQPEEVRHLPRRPDERHVDLEPPPQLEELEDRGRRE